MVRTSWLHKPKSGVLRSVLKIYLHTKNQNNLTCFAKVAWHVLKNLLFWVLWVCLKKLLLRNCKFAVVCTLGNAQQNPVKKIVSTCRQHWCLSTCKKSTLFPASFTIYYTLKIPAIWLDESILTHKSRTRILPDMGFAQKY